MCGPIAHTSCQGEPEPTNASPDTPPAEREGTGQETESHASIAGDGLVETRSLRRIRPVDANLRPTVAIRDGAGFGTQVLPFECRTRTTISRAVLGSCWSLEEWRRTSTSGKGCRPNSVPPRTPRPWVPRPFAHPSPPLLPERRSKTRRCREEGTPRHLHRSSRHPQRKGRTSRRSKELGALPTSSSGEPPWTPVRAGRRRSSE